MRLLGELGHHVDVQGLHDLFVEPRMVRLEAFIRTDAVGGWTAPWNSTPISTPEPCFSRSALKRSTTSSTNFCPSLYLNGERCVAAQLHLHRVHAVLGVDGAVHPDAVARRAAEQVVDRHAEHLALDVPERHVDAARDRGLDRTAAIEGAAMDGLPVVHDA